MPIVTLKGIEPSVQHMRIRLLNAEGARRDVYAIQKGAAVVSQK